MHSHVQKTYKKVSQIEHILLRPDTYIGSVRQAEEMMWIVEGEQFVQKKITYIPGLYKIFDEILVNAADNYQRDKKMSRIEVRITRDQVSVMNDGKGIPVQIHKAHKIYVPELIFGNLLTSSNYEDKQKKVVGGRNGYGAKLANLFSTHFQIEAADSLNKKIYKQSWTNNMMEKGDPSIETFSGTDYTKVTYRPDFSRFEVNKFSPDMINLMKRRVYDISGILKVKVFLNGKMVQVPNFKQYSKMHLDNPNENLAESKDKNGRWHVLACRSSGQFTQVSFVNGISTSKGGTHVNYILDQIVGKIMEHIAKKKIVGVKPFQVKAHLSLFINCLIENPCFNSQVKQMLTTSASNFGSHCNIDDDFIKVLLKSGIAQRIINDVKAKEHSKIQRELKKAKKSRLIIPKLEDANEAGRSNNCCLILTEGDSAKALALCGLEVLGRDFFGVFPLRGKPANVKSMTPKMVMDNAELSSIVMIIGLTFGKQYTNTNGLRYSSVMIMADQDIDGSHIKGLVINFFQTFWPSLCKVQGFLKQFITPIIKCRKGDSSINFYSMIDYNKWQSENQDSGWTVKYYKGLGTSTAKQAKQYFSSLQTHEIKFSYRSEEDHKALDLAFDKKNANLRKQWLGEYDPESGLDHRIKRVTIEDFVNKELIHFSNEDNARSIPSVMDGLKPSQRKILYACFKRNLTKQIKVAQLAGYVAEHSAYHHGQMSLCGAIISMAQNFVGSNNLNILEPLGQFGTRYEKGKDYASSRYIFTKLNPLTRYIFKEEDDHVVQYQHEQSQNIEPNYYLPILPMILINGAQGIGTGWSTSIQPHKVEDVIAMMKDRIKGKQRDISIGWEGFRGQVQRVDRGSFVVKGVYQTEQQTVTIRQIPVSRGIRQYKAFLQQKLPSQQNQNPDLQDLKEYHHDTFIEFVIRFNIDNMPDDSEMLKYLKLTSNCQLNNMHLFNPSKRIVKYESVQQIVNEFYSERIKGYHKRKRYLISKFKKQRDLLDNQVRFIHEVMDGRFKMVQSKGEWVNLLRNRGYTRFQQLNKIESTKNKEQDQNQKNSDFNYLLTMPIWSFCHEKIKDMTSVREQLNAITEYYQNITENQMWMQDIESFEKAWLASIEGKEVKVTNSNKNRLAVQAPRKRRSVARGIQSDEEQIVTEKKTSRRNRNMMEEEVEKVTEHKEGRKKQKRQQPSVLEEIKPLNLVPASQKIQEKKSTIDSILSKYLCNSDSKGGQLSLIDRIKARLEGGESSLKSSYEEGKEEVSAIKKKMQQKEDEMEDEDEIMKQYLL